VALHQLEGIRERLVGLHGDRVHHHAALEAFYRAHGRGLLVGSRLRWSTPSPPSCAITIAMSASVTVSMAEDMIGMFSVMSRVTRLRVSAWLGRMSDSAGWQQDVVEGEAEANVHWVSSAAAIAGGANWVGSAKARASATRRFASSTAPPYSIGASGPSAGP
jgi:hypothetical protein